MPYGQWGRQKLRQSFTCDIDVELPQAFGGFVAENRQKSDQTAMNRLGGEVENGVEAGRLSGVFGELERCGGVDVAVGQTGQFDWNYATVLKSALVICCREIGRKLVDVSLQIAVDVFKRRGDGRKFCGVVVDE